MGVWEFVSVYVLCFCKNSMWLMLFTIHYRNFKTIGWLG